MKNTIIPDVIDKKSCSGCKEEKPLAAFSISTRNKVHGRKSKCKSCVKIESRERYEFNRNNLISKYSSDIGWKWIEGYEGLYQVSVWGEVRSFGEGNVKTMVGKSNGGGRLCITLCRKNLPKKTFQIHRLVGLAFIPNPLNKSDINHKNGNAKDNRLENLEWSTRSENHLHAYAMGLKKTTPVAQLTREGRVVDFFISISEAERKTNISAKNISACMIGKRRMSGGFCWQKLA